MTRNTLHDVEKTITPDEDRWVMNVPQEDVSIFMAIDDDDSDRIVGPPKAPNGDKALQGEMIQLGYVGLYRFKWIEAPTNRDVIKPESIQTSGSRGRGPLVTV